MTETTKYSSWVVQTRVKQIRDSGRQPFWTTDKWPYICNGLTDRHEIWHGDANWPSEPHGQLKFQTFKNPRRQAADRTKCDGEVLRVESAGKIMTFAVLKRRILPRRETVFVSVFDISAYICTWRVDCIALDWRIRLYNYDYCCCCCCCKIDRWIRCPPCSSLVLPSFLSLPAYAALEMHVSANVRW